MSLTIRTDAVSAMQKSTLALDADHVWHPFTQSQTAPAPLAIAKGKGAWLEDEAGKKYLDLISSWWVNMHGHAHPKIAKAIADQAHTLEQVVFAGCTHRPAAELASKIAAVLPEDLSRVFFSDDGSTAVEVALKIALQYWANIEQPKNRFLAFDGSYHGDTVGAMSVGNGSGFFDGFAAMLFKVNSLPYPATWMQDEDLESKEEASINALEAELAKADVAAIIIEPLVQGAGGMRMVRAAWLEQVVQLAKQYNTLVIFDEVMTGFGRTGKLFSLEHLTIAPDIVCFSKGLTGGFLPMSLTVCRESLYEKFLGENFAKALAHGHSYTANPLACAAALASLKITLADATKKSWQMIESVHQHWLSLLHTILPTAINPRCIGTIAAFDLAVADTGYTAKIGDALKKAFLDAGLLLRPLGNTVYFMPPYCITEQELGIAWEEALACIRAIDYMQ